MFILLGLFLASFRTQAQTLVLHHADGTTTDVELFTQPRVQFQNDRLVITSPVLSIDCACEDVLRFTYKGGVTTGISSPKGEADMSRDGDRLVFRNVSKADRVAIYKSNGIRVPLRLSFTGTDAVLPLSQIPQGVYLLSVNGRTSKFTRP